MTARAREAGGVTNRWQEQFGYVYDAAGNLNMRTNNTLVQTFGVNTLNELTLSTNAGPLTVAGSTTPPATSVMVNTSNALLYADTTFASTNQPWVNGANTYTAIAQNATGNRCTNSVTVNLATNGYTYDLNGNLLSDGTRNFAYDDENELISVWQTNVWRNDFVYDGKLRRRIARDFTWSGSAWTETNETRFIYDGNLVVQERNTSNQPVVEYTRGNDLSGTLQGAGGIGGLLARSQDSLPPTPFYAAHSYYHADGNGSVMALISASQAVVAKYLYDPFGNTLAQSGSLADANAYRFSSKEWYVNSGLYYYLYRFYDPNLQRWPNPDPSDDLGFKVIRRDRSNFSANKFNLIMAFNNDPCDLYDLNGLDCSDNGLKDAENFLGVCLKCVPAWALHQMDKSIQRYYNCLKDTTGGPGIRGLIAKGVEAALCTALFVGTEGAFGAGAGASAVGCLAGAGGIINGCQDQTDRKMGVPVGDKY